MLDFVTTMNKKLFDDYGKDLLVSYMNTSQKYPMFMLKMIYKNIT